MKRALLTAACILAVTAPASAGMFSSETRVRQVVDCSDLRLKTASGVPNKAKHAYALAGTCRLVAQIWGDGDRKPDKEVGRAFLTLAAVWTGKDNMFREQGKLEGGASGTFSTVLKCSADPYLHNVGCTVMAHTNGTPWEPLSDQPKKGRPIGQGHVNATQAANLSRQSASSAPPPPPPPPPPAKKPPVLKAPLAGKGAMVQRSRAPVIPKPPGRKPPKPGQSLQKPELNGGLLKGGMKPGVNLFGSDYRGFPMSQPQPKLCRNACMSDARCRAWTYVKPGIKGPRAACYLKNRVPRARKDPCCVSGIK